MPNYIIIKLRLKTYGNIASLYYKYCFPVKFKTTVGKETNLVRWTSVRQPFLNCRK